LLILLLGVLSGCFLRGPGLVRVAGWPVDGRVDCQELAVWRIDGCDRIIGLAKEKAIAARVNIAVHEPTIYHLDTYDESTGQSLLVRSGGGGEYVVVFGQGEGAFAVGVWCGAGIEPDICGTFEDGIPY